jgi:hypothetical protein
MQSTQVSPLWKRPAGQALQLVFCAPDRQVVVAGGGGGGGEGTAHAAPAPSQPALACVLTAEPGKQVRQDVASGASEMDEFSLLTRYVRGAQKSQRVEPAEPTNRPFWHSTHSLAPGASM